MDATLFSSLYSAALAAPSAENQHYFSLEWQKGQLLLMPQMDRAQIEPGRVPLHGMAAGAMVENLRLALSQQKLDCTIAFPPIQGREPWAILTPTTGGSFRPEDAGLASIIHQRCTNRRIRFHGPAIPAPLRAALAAWPDDELQVSWIAPGPNRRRMAYLALRAERLRYCVASLHQEMFSKIRFGLGWHDTTDSGLPPGALGLQRWEQLSFPIIAHWANAQTLARLGGHYFFGARAAALPILLCPELAVIHTTPDDQDFRRAGQLMQRLWLRATAMGYAVQPLFSPALFATGRLPDVPRQESDRLQALWRNLLGERQAAMVLRLGHAPGPAVRTTRPPVPAILPAELR